MIVTTMSKYEIVYYDPTNEAALGGLKKLAAATDSNVKATKTWARGQLAYSLHKPARKRFPTRAYRTEGIDDLWQIDLMEMIPFANINKGYRYIMTCIDVFSRYAYVMPLRSKGDEEVAKAMQKVLANAKPPPNNIQTDRGKEFYNQHVQRVFKKYNVNHYTVNSQFKAPIVERFNRTLREKLNRWFTHKGSKVWYNVLPQILQAYNNSKHSGIFKWRPSEVTRKNEHKLWQLKQEEQQQKYRKPTIPLLNYVRISKVGDKFIKNFDQNWSDEVFRVVGIDQNQQPVMYILEDLKHNIIEGKFYEEELQDIGKALPTIYRIEKVIRARGKGKDKEYLVKWHGFDSTHNMWIPATSINRPNK